MLHSKGLQRVEHNLETGQQQQHDILGVLEDSRKSSVPCKVRKHFVCIQNLNDVFKKNSYFRKHIGKLL